MKCRTDRRYNVGEDKAENVAYNKSAKNIGKEVHASQQALAFNLAVKSESKQQAQQIYEDSSRNGIFKCEQIGISNS